LEKFQRKGNENILITLQDRKHTSSGMKKTTKLGTFKCTVLIGTVSPALEETKAEFVP
jgi:hypothetical protein